MKEWALQNALQAYYCNSRIGEDKLFITSYVSLKDDSSVQLSRFITEVESAVNLERQGNMIVLNNQQCHWLIFQVYLHIGFAGCFTVLQ